MVQETNLYVFYDGECGLCNASVQFVLRNEKTKQLYFSALQSDFSKKFFSENNFPAPDYTTVYFFRNGKLYERSKAILLVTKYLRFPYSMLQIFVVVPSFLRNYVYTYISARRRKWFPVSCAIPSAEHEARFLK